MLVGDLVKILLTMPQDDNISIAMEDNDNDKIIYIADENDEDWDIFHDEDEFEDGRQYKETTIWAFGKKTGG